MTATGVAVRDLPTGGTWATATDRCPKHMQHGPCAGVTGDGRCEVPAFGACTFLDVPVDEWPYGGSGDRAPAPDHPFLALAARRPVVVVDLPTNGLSSTTLLAAAAELRGVADAVLLGDHGAARLQLPPSYRARLLADAGLAAWVGINCRDRNRVAIEAELAACADIGVAGVHCVTGDHPALGDRPEAQPVFDLDCVGVLELARRHGLLASAAHAPAAPPVERRVPRLLAKAAAGADVAFLDHCGGPSAVADAVTALRTAGYGGLVIACVPIVLDCESAEVVESFAGDRLPGGYVRRVLAAADPAREGAAVAVELSRELLAVPGVGGVDLSGGAGPGREVAQAAVLAEIGSEVLRWM